VSRYDVAIVGAGIAGASLAAEVAPHASVLLVEAEDQPGYHSTGRSAAFWSETYGGPHVQPLTSGSEAWFRDRGLLHPRRALYLGRLEDEPAIAAFLADFAGTKVRLERLPIERARAWLPHLAPEWDRAVWEASCTDIDVAGAHQTFLKTARQAGAELRCGAPLRTAERAGDGWRLQAGRERVEAAVLVDAAGAWADAVAGIAGVPSIGIQPYRRTVVQLAVDPPAPSDLPLVMDMEGSFYFKPEAGRLWLSPHDETPDVACDAAPDELDVALAIDRFQRAVGWPIVRVERKWAGLRSFAPDRLPVYGFDPLAPGFFWCAGQGGFGIQTAPAAARMAAALLLGRHVAELNPAPYLPDRFR
jgi:D-arginine dehydrogenase